jgi:hypothetical protein
MILYDYFFIMETGAIWNKILEQTKKGRLACITNNSHIGTLGKASCTAQYIKQMNTLKIDIKRVFLTDYKATNF